MRRRRVWLALAGALIVAAGVIAVVVARRQSAVPTQESAAPPAETGTVKFLMEQQWAVRMMLAKAEPATVARCRWAAELAGGTTRAEEHHLVLAVVIDVDQVPVPAGRAPGRAPFAFAADQLRRH